MVPPYVLRHTVLTRLADAGCDVFALARIAGHSSITTTQRYVHPQADAIERAFAKFGAVPVTTAEKEKPKRVGTKLGTAKKGLDRAPLELVGAKGGI